MKTKKNLLILLSCLFLTCGQIFSFAQDKEKKCLKEIPVKKGVLYDCLDLSQQNLDSMPNLSHLKIKELNLSHNKISEFNEEFLPINVKKIDLSHNDLTKFKFPAKDCVRLPVLVNLSEINLSHNKLTQAEIYYLGNLPELKNIRLNNNNLSFLHLQDPKYVEYLDISDNLNLRNDLSFHPEKIKIIKHDNISNNNPLIYFLDVPSNCFVE